MRPVPVVIGDIDTFCEYIQYIVGGSTSLGFSVLGGQFWQDIHSGKMSPDVYLCTF